MLLSILGSSISQIMGIAILNQSKEKIPSRGNQLCNHRRTFPMDRIQFIIGNHLWCPINLRRIFKTPMLKVKQLWPHIMRKRFNNKRILCREKHYNPIVEVLRFRKASSPHIRKNCSRIISRHSLNYKSNRWRLLKLKYRSWEMLKR